MGVSSMTGFARSEGEGDGISWVWEVRSVNGRALELRLRLPPGFEPLEPQLRAALGQRCRRGNVSATLSVTRLVPPAIRVNRPMLDQIVALMRDLSRDIAKDTEVAPPRLDGLLAVRGVIETVEEDPEPVIMARRGAVLAGWSQALDRLAAARREEGARLEALLGELSGLASPVSEERVAQELAMLVTRADVREELDRLHAHIAQAGELLQRGEAIGRELDFLCQELNREANTLCSKSADIELTRIGLSLKAAIEQFREQVQNLE